MKIDRKTILAVVLAVAAFVVVGWQFRSVISASTPATTVAAPVTTPPAISSSASPNVAVAQAGTAPENNYDAYIGSVKLSEIAYGRKDFRNPMKPLVSEPGPERPRPSGPATNVTVGPTNALKEGYTIEGIVWNEVQPLALVNEQIVTVGERLKNGALITKITPDTVRFTRDGIEYYLVFREE